MGVLTDSWCFCKGGGKSEKMKAALLAGKGPSMASISTTATVSGTGFLIHRNLLLTTHAVLPSVASAEAAQIRLPDGASACVFPHRFFITSSILDLTVVGLDTLEGDSNAQGQQAHYLKTCSQPNLDLGSAVYLLGYMEKRNLSVGEGKVVIATDNLIKLSTDAETWSPGTAGFDVQGNLAFMICNPTKLATSPNTKSSTTSSSSTTSWKKGLSMQFGIPMPIICDWLRQHWEGSLDELNKPKLPLIRLMSTGQKSEHSSASFTLRQVFKSTEARNDRTPSSSNSLSKPRQNIEISCSIAPTFEEDSQNGCPEVNPHLQGIPTPEIYESPKLTAAPLGKKESAHIQLLDINFPPRVSQQPAKKLFSESGENRQVLDDDPSPENKIVNEQSNAVGDAEMSSTGSVGDALSEAQSSSSPIEVSAVQNGYSSEGETMYSAETAESRNYTSPRETRFQPVDRSQSCVSYRRWGSAQRNAVAGRGMPERQGSATQREKMYSHGATSQRGNVFFSPTVSSIMKKRNNSDEPSKPRQHATHSSPRWMF